MCKQCVPGLSSGGGAWGRGYTFAHFRATNYTLILGIALKIDMRKYSSTHCVIVVARSCIIPLCTTLDQCRQQLKLSKWGGFHCHLTLKMVHHKLLYLLGSSGSSSTHTKTRSSLHSQKPFIANTHKLL